MYIVYALFNYAVSSSDYIARDDRMISKCIDSERVVVAELKVLLWHLSGESEEIHEKSQS
jgi:hypothetical protein